MELDMKLTPIRISIAFDEKDFKNPKHLFKLDKKYVAAQIAEYILENGFIAEHGFIRSSNEDTFEYRFSMWALKPQRGFP